MDTFEVRVKKMWLAHDAGLAVNPMAAEGQVEGGTLQSLGYALMEKHLVSEGKFLTTKFQNYIIPTFADTPDMETRIVEKPYKYGPMGAKGIGEMPMNGGPAAVANAIADAIGEYFCELPITPEMLYERMKGKI
jgi:CO/xanthine dehydrogenase Mo-binding subunit